MPLPYQEDHHFKTIKKLLYLVSWVMLVYVFVDIVGSTSLSFFMVFIESSLALMSAICLLKFDEWFKVETSRVISLVIINVLLVFYLYTVTLDIFPTHHLWVFVIPVLTYMFTGPKWGRYITTFYVVASLFIVLIKHHTVLSTLPIEAYNDTALSFISLWILIHLYEKSNETSKQKLQELAITDALTQLSNRHAFYDMYKDNQDESLGLIIIDLDWFKIINDTYGHDAGDVALVEVGKVLISFQSDKTKSFRLGGEEFAIMLINCKDDFAVELADRVLNAIRDINIEYGEHIIEITASLGLAFCLKGDESNPAALLNELIRLSDKHLYRAKKNGRDQVVHD